MSLTREELQEKALENKELKPEEFRSTIERAVAAASTSSSGSGSSSGSVSVSSNDIKLSRGAKRFPWILKNWKRKQVCYDGDQGFINETIDPYYAQRWYEQNNKYQRDVKEKFFGDDEVFCFYLGDPNTDNDDIKQQPVNITSQFAEFLGLLAANRILKEKNFRVWQTILNTYDLYEIDRPAPYISDQFFAPKLNPVKNPERLKSENPVDTRVITSPDQLKDKQLQLFIKENDPEIFKILEEALKIPRDTDDKNQLVKRDKIFDNVMKEFNKRYKGRKAYGEGKLSWENAPLKEAYNFPAIAGMSLTEIQELCAMKDFLMGKIKFKPSILKGKIIEHPYTNTTLSTQTVTLATSPNFGKPIELFGHYTSSVRYAMFGEEKYYKRIRPGQTLQPRQWIAKLYTGWVTSVVAPRRGGKCLEENQLVRLYDGTFKKARDIKIGDLLLGSNGEPVKVVDTDSYKKECYEIELNNGMKSVVSYDHRIPTQSTYSIKGWSMDIDDYTKAEDLTTNDFCATNNLIFKNKEGNDIDYKKGLSLGLMLGDGIRGTNSLCQYEKPICDYIINKLKGHVQYNSNNNRIYISQNLFSKKDYSGSDEISYNKYLDNAVFGENFEFKRGLVEGMLLTDGYIQIEKKKKGSDGYIRNKKILISYCSTSKNLIDGLQIILGDLGIFSYVRKKKIKSKFKSNTDNIAYNLFVSGKTDLMKLLSMIDLSSKRNFDLIEFDDSQYMNTTLNTIPLEAFKREHGESSVVIGKHSYFGQYREANYNFNREKSKAYGVEHWNRYFWAKVVGLKNIGEKNVIHIECDGDHTFWTGGVLTHNSYRGIEEAVEMFTADTQERSKPIRVLFVGINTKKLKTVVKYLLSFTKQFTQAGYFDREASKNIMHYRRKEDNKKATEADDLGTIEFIGSKDEDAGVGDYADLIIIDECERIDENVWEDIMPIITNEGARCILISTLNKNSQKTWFYQQLIQGETEELQRNLMQQDVVTVIREKRNKRVQPTIDKVKQIEEETGQAVDFEEWINWIDIDAMAADMRYARQRVGLRFTGEDNDLKTEKEKGFARDRLRGTKAYYPERRAIFPEDTGVYDYESSIKDSTYFQGRKYKFVVVAYDPAESKDKAALTYLGYDGINNKIELFRIEKLPNNYTYHGPFIKKTLTECIDRINVSDLPDGIGPEQRVFFAYDFNGVGQGLEPFFQECGVRIDLKVRFTGQGGINKKGINHNVPKELLVNMLQNTMDHGALVINQDCQEFIEELDHYKSYYNPDTGNTKYQAERGSSDDFVSAAMIGTYFILEYMGEKFNITKNEIEQAVDPDSNMTVNDMFKEVEKIVMQGINNGKTVQQVIDEYNGRSQRNSLKRQDVLSQFGY